MLARFTTHNNPPPAPLFTTPHAHARICTRVRARARARTPLRYGSITEDYNTAMQLLGDGFSSMFLNQRLVYGLAPDDVGAAMTQRLRWSMGSLQIFLHNNPLFFDGLTWPQALLFFASVLQCVVAISRHLPRMHARVRDP